MIVDACLYAGERDLLELRFEVLKEKVDFFLVIEGKLTFTGTPRVVKHDWCIENRNVAVTHGIVSDFPEASPRNPWKREMHQRNQILAYLKDLPADTLVMVSDVDEIPDPDLVQDRDDIYIPGGLLRFQHKTYHFNFNNRVVNDNSAKNGWSGTSVCRLGDLRKWFPQGVRNRVDDVAISYSGWHFSWFWNPEEKLKAYSHVELDQMEGSIPDRVQRRWDYEYENIPGMSHLPKAIQDNPEKWRKYFATNDG